MGWITAFALSALTLIGLALSGRCPRIVLELAGAFILAAMAGYAWQGTPDMPGHPVERAGR